MLRYLSAGYEYPLGYYLYKYPLGYHPTEDFHWRYKIKLSVTLHCSFPRTQQHCVWQSLAQCVMKCHLLVAWHWSTMKHSHCFIVLLKREVGRRTSSASVNVDILISSSMALDLECQIRGGKE